MAPFTIFIGQPEGAHHPLHFQADWLSKERGGMIPPDVMDAVSQLWELAKKNGVSLEELCVYALGTKEDQEALEKENMAEAMSEFESESEDDTDSDFGSSFTSEDAEPEAEVDVEFNPEPGKSTAAEEQVFEEEQPLTKKRKTKSTKKPKAKKPKG